MEIWKRNLLVCWFGVLFVAIGMSQVAPVLPLYVEQLGVHDPAEVARWSGIALGVNYIAVAIFSPIWGRVADKYGRKPMLLRASLWLAFIVIAMGFAQNVYQLVGLRMMQGALAGFISAAITLVASQTPKERAGWALGLMSTAHVGGSLLGPLLGGVLAEIIGVRGVFFSMGLWSILSFGATYLYIKEEFSPVDHKTLGWCEVWRRVHDPKLMVGMLFTTFIVQLALMSIQPVITIYIASLSTGTAYVALMSGVVFAASGVASVLAAPRLGRLADRLGAHKVLLAGLVIAGVLHIPQAFVHDAWQLVILRFLLGIATAGLLPSINTLVRRSTDDEIIGQAFGYNQSAQYLGAFAGSLWGGAVTAALGFEYVFILTGVLLLGNALWAYLMVYKKIALVDRR